MDTSKFPFYEGNSTLDKIMAYAGLFLFSKGVCNILNSDYFKQLNNEAKLLRTVAAASGKDVLIDASKSIVRAIALSRILKDEFEPHFIHLYRQPVSVIYSTLKKNMSVKLDDREIVYTKKKIPTLHEATDSWCRGNNSNLVLSRIFGINPIYLCYEDFTINPKATFLEVGSRLGLDWEESMVNLSQGGHHMVSGNLSRINAKRVNAAKEEWKSMDSKDQAYIRDNTKAVLEKIRSRVRASN